MENDTAVIWSGKLPTGIEKILREVLDQGTRQNRKINVFFRADDIARVDESFSRLMHLFLSSRTPLCLAVVPGWLEENEWKEMQQFNPVNSSWCWHQHGWSHTNHEAHGKKNEFGPSRSRDDVFHDLDKGRKHLTALLGDLFYPVFTPPWNRCSTFTLELLEKLDFRAVSRSLHAKPLYQGKLPDLAINVDLHTRKEKDWQEGWNQLLTDFRLAACSGRIGLMLHHLKMNDAAFEFLSFLLSLLHENPATVFTTFRELT